MFHYQKYLKFHRLLLALTVLYLLFFLFSHKNVFLKPFNYEYFGELYSESQYIKGQASKRTIGDDGLYAFAGYYYITGGDVSQVNFEHPPMGKYLIGVSEYIFGNENIINIIYAILFIVVVYQLGLLLLSSKLLAASATLLVSTDKLITTQYIAPQLDLPTSLTFLIGVYFLLKIIKIPTFKYSAAASIFFSISLVMKFFPFLFLLMLTVIFVLFISKKYKAFKYFCLTSFIFFPLIYLCVHMSYFLHNHTLLDFIKYQHWILIWRSGNPFVPGNLLSHLLAGHYYTWYGVPKIMLSDEWTFQMSLVFILGMIGVWLWRKKFENLLISALVVVNLLYATLFTIGQPMYILPVYPFLAMAAVYTFSEIFKFMKRKNIVI